MYRKSTRWEPLSSLKEVYMKHAASHQRRPTNGQRHISTNTLNTFSSIVHRSISFSTFPYSCFSRICCRISGRNSAGRAGISPFDCNTGGVYPSMYLELWIDSQWSSIFRKRDYTDFSPCSSVLLLEHKVEIQNKTKQVEGSQQCRQMNKVINI